MAKKKNWYTLFGEKVPNNRIEKQYFKCEYGFVFLGGIEPATPICTTGNVHVYKTNKSPKLLVDKKTMLQVRDIMYSHGANYIMCYNLIAGITLDILCKTINTQYAEYNNWMPTASINRGSHLVAVM